MLTCCPTTQHTRTHVNTLPHKQTNKQTNKPKNKEKMNISGQTNKLKRKMFCEEKLESF